MGGVTLTGAKQTLSPAIRADLVPGGYRSVVTGVEASRAHCRLPALASTGASAKHGLVNAR
jgi:hypothetical protein